METRDASPSGQQAGAKDLALRDYLGIVTLIALAGGIALILLGCQTSMVLSTVSGSI